MFLDEEDMTIDYRTQQSPSYNHQAKNIRLPRTDDTAGALIRETLPYSVGTNMALRL